VDPLSLSRARKKVVKNFAMPKKLAEHVNWQQTGKI
jgi:hypothetical protein